MTETDNAPNNAALGEVGQVVLLCDVFIGDRLRLEVRASLLPRALLTARRSSR